MMVMDGDDEKKMTLGRVVDCEKTPRLAAGGIDPPQSLMRISLFGQLGL
jgi:hypothetical protein